VRCPFYKSESVKVHQKNGHAYSTMYRRVDCQRFLWECRNTGFSGLPPGEDRADRGLLGPTYDRAP